MRIVPAIDIIDGKCVRLSKGDYNTAKIYNEDPLEVARQFESHGIEYLHLVDLDGARSRHIVNHKVLYNIAKNTSLKIDFGGGLKTDDDLRIAFENGARQVTGGSIAVKDRTSFCQWIETYGAEKIILGADARDGKIAVNGWQESCEEDLFDFIQFYLERGIKNVICTDIARDGMLQGPSVQLYGEILEKTGIQPRTNGRGINLIASGGIAKMDDLYQLREIGCEAAIVGKAIYENRIPLKGLEQFIIRK